MTVRVYYLCNVGRSSALRSGSLVLGITPMIVLLSDVPFNSRWLTCMFRGESTLKRMVEPGRRTSSWVSSSGRRLGILIPASDAMVPLFLKAPCLLSSNTCKLVRTSECQNKPFIFKLPTSTFNIKVRIHNLRKYLIKYQRIEQR